MPSILDLLKKNSIIKARGWRNPMRIVDVLAKGSTWALLLVDNKGSLEIKRVEEWQISGFRF